jgi:hypothetical protein
MIKSKSYGELKQKASNSKTLDTLFLIPPKNSISQNPQYGIGITIEKNVSEYPISYKIII